MKNAYKLSGTFVLLYAACAAEFQVGNGAFQLDTSLMGVYDSNLRASSDSVSDYYLSFEPILRYRLPGGRFDTDAYAGVRIKRYLDNTESNSNDADAHLTWRMQRIEGQTTGASLELGYSENTEPVVEVNDQVRSKNFLSNASGEVLVAGRNLLSAGFSYHDNQHNIGSNQTGSTGRLGYSFIGFTDGTTVNLNYDHQQSKSTENVSGATTIDQTANTGTLSVSHPLYAQLIASLAYGYRWLDRGAQEALLGLQSDSGSFYSVNFQGPFLPRQYFPKTTGTFRIAYEQAQTPGLNDRSNERLVGQINLSWAARETTNVRFTAGRSQDLSINDNTVVNETATLGVTQGIGQFVDTDFSVSYTNADFVNLARTDDRYEARASATYKINRVWSSALTYRFLHSESNLTIANYDRHVVSGTVTYAF